jgi:hypothetical protein
VTKSAIFGVGRDRGGSAPLLWRSVAALRSNQQRGQGGNRNRGEGEASQGRGPSPGSRRHALRSFRSGLGIGLGREVESASPVNDRVRIRP